MSDLRELYQEVILDHNKSPHNFREVPDADRRAEGDNPLCGDVVTVYVTLDGDRLRDVAFQGAGCAISQASASMMTDAVRGMTLDEARVLSRKFRDLLTDRGDEPVDAAELGKLAVFGGVKEFPMRVKCATLAWHTLAAALDHQEGGRGSGTGAGRETPVTVTTEE
ncbi:MAG: SUF system NifU family Fe-S cluster assembly protein [Acidobacteriota bacterium]|jgi:nitrogen fixation NifU-like protein